MYRSEVAGVLPTGGVKEIGGVTLPPGRLVVPDPLFVRGKPVYPVMWASEGEVPEVGAVWQRLAEGFETHGLWPVVLGTLRRDPNRPWFSGELAPGAAGGGHDVAKVLAEVWTRCVPDSTEDHMTQFEPFTHTFPGLAPASTGEAQSIPEAMLGFGGRLGLVPVRRPADVLAAIGWTGPLNFQRDMGIFASVLRSWEDRFGAYVVAVGFDTLSLVVERPLTGAETLAVAAEHFAFCPDNIFQGAGSISKYARGLAGAPVWQFWWD